MTSGGPNRSNSPHCSNLPVSDRFDPARQIGDAVLYEGYVLYPYRASAAKNQLRWQFGVLVPRAESEEGAEAWSMQTDCIVDAGKQARIDVRVRCLQVQSRAVEQAGADGFHPVETLELDGVTWAAWDEAVEHEFNVDGLGLGGVVELGEEMVINLPATRAEEMLHDADGAVVGRLVRERWPVVGRIGVVAEWCEGPYPLAKVTVAVENTTFWRQPGAPRSDILRRSLVGVHTLLAVDDGRWLSMLDPPEFARAAVATCESRGTFPVLIGEPGADNLILSSPIILYDYPEVAAESQGDMFDATEIDEILALRILTLTDEEKQEARGTDARVAAILDRCELMPPELWDRLHGAVRSLRRVNSNGAGPSSEADPGNGAGPSSEVRDGNDGLPWWDPAVDAGFDPWTDTVWVGSGQVAKGSRVRLRPNRRADAYDLFLIGRTATVEGVFHDVDDDVHLAVVLEDDPAADLHQWHGRYLYFHPDEVELLDVTP